jgi:hypothetical protein
MEKKYAFWIRFNLFVFLLSLAGFSFSYLKYAPHFDGFSWTVHLHFVAFTLWFVVLMVQPYLIKTGRRAAHRLLGQLTYGLMFVLVVTIFLMVRRQVAAQWETKPAAANLSAFVGMIDALSLLVYFSIAMWNWRKVRWHLAFILACTLVIFNPGLSRFCNALLPGSGLPVGVLMPYAVTGALLLYEKRKRGRSVRSSPYFVFLLAWTLEILLLLTVPGSSWWHTLVEQVFVA